MKLEGNLVTEMEMEAYLEMFDLEMEDDGEDVFQKW